MRYRPMMIAGLAAMALGASLGGCDKSPQNADGTTNAGDLGVAGTTLNAGVVADTGADTGAGNDIGGAGELSAGSNSAGSNTAASSGGGAAQ